MPRVVCKLFRRRAITWAVAQASLATELQVLKQETVCVNQVCAAAKSERRGLEKIRIILRELI